MLNVILALYVISLNPKLSTLLSHGSKPSTSGRGDKESTSLRHRENFRRSRLVSPRYRPGQDTSAVPVGGEESMGCFCATSNYTSGGESCSSFCLVTFPDATTPRMSKSYPCSLSNASQLAYAGVVYLRMIDEQGDIHTSMVISETKVAPVMRSTIPRLDLYGARATCLP